MDLTGIRLLGEVAVVRQGEVQRAGSVRLRTCLALLALQAGQAVAGDRLVSEMWGDDPPRSARSSLHVNITRVRAWLGDAGSLTGSGRSYTLGIRRSDVDLLAFLDAADLALRTRDRADYEHAVSLWREPVLPDIDSRVLRAARMSAEERRARLEAQ